MPSRPVSRLRVLKTTLSLSRLLRQLSCAIIPARNPAKADQPTAMWGWQVSSMDAEAGHGNEVLGCLQSLYDRLFFPIESRTNCGITPVPEGFGRMTAGVSCGGRLAYSGNL